jgi:3-isopropylmalate/(R)-2-methylmalate dehydratase small subunit
VAGRNFGCGSSREHAPWAIQDFGFDVVIAPSFADIFRTNCTKIGMLPVILPEDDVRTIMREAMDQPGIEMTVDLEECVVALPDGRTVEFHIEDSVRDRLLNGWDDIGLTLTRSDAIDAYEADRERVGPVTSILL